MDDLGDLEPGDRVRVRSRRGTLIYETTRVRDYTTEQVAEHAYDLFGQDREEGRLVLVTCTDWDGKVYRSNTIVFADPIGARRTASDPGGKKKAARGAR
jgi:sortase (surface protein transpeptidase)